MTHSSGKSTMSLSGSLLQNADDLGGVGRRVGHRGPGRGAGDADKAILVHVRSARPVFRRLDQVVATDRLVAGRRSRAIGDCRAGRLTEHQHRE